MDTVCNDDSPLHEYAKTNQFLYMFFKYCLYTLGIVNKTVLTVMSSDKKVCIRCSCIDETMSWPLQLELGLPSFSNWATQVSERWVQL